MGNQQEIDIAWLAGIVDGEGSFALTKNNGTKHPTWNARKVDIAIPNSDERVIVKAISVMESIGIKPYLTVLEPADHQTLLRWRVGVTRHEHVLRLTEALIPHLTAKREQAILMKRYVESRLRNRKHHMTQSEIKLANKMLQFNKPLSRSSTTAREGALNKLINY